MVLSTKDYKLGYIAETNYAGGVAGVKYAETQIANDAALTVMNYPESELSLGKYEYERERFEGVGVAGETKQTFTKGIKYGELTITQYVQNSTWIDMSIQEEVSGDLAESFTIHVEKAGRGGVIDYFDIFGCVLTEYKLNVTNDDWPTETLTFAYYSIGDGVAHSTLSSPLTTQPKIPKDFTITIGAAFTDCFEFDLTITNTTLDKMNQAKYQRMDSIFISRQAEVNLSYLTDSGSIYGETIDETAVTNHSVVIAGWGKSLTITNMGVTEENIEKMPGEKGIDEFTSKLELAGASTLTTA